LTVVHALWQPPCDTALTHAWQASSARKVGMPGCLDLALHFGFET